MCFLCHASSTKPDLLWPNSLANSGRRMMGMKNDEAWRADLRANGVPIPAWLLYVVGLRLDCVMPDVLHTVDLGISAHIIGNVFFIFCVLRGVLGGSDFDDRVSKLSERMDRWYKDTNCPSRLRGKLTLDKIRPSGDWPGLKGNAAVIRHLAPFAKMLVDEFQDGSAHDILVQMVCTLLCRFYGIISMESQFLTPEIKENNSQQ